MPQLTLPIFFMVLALEQSRSPVIVPLPVKQPGRIWEKLHHHNSELRVSNQWQLICLFKSLIRLTTKKSPKLRITGSVWWKIHQWTDSLHIQIQSSAVITRSNLSRFYTQRCRTWLRLENHNRHPIPRPNGRAMECLLSGNWRKLTAL